MRKWGNWDDVGGAAVRAVLNRGFKSERRYGDWAIESNLRKTEREIDRKRGSWNIWETRKFGIF